MADLLSIATIEGAEHPQMHLANELSLMVHRLLSDLLNTTVIANPAWNII